MNKRHQQNDELNVLFEQRKANIDAPNDFENIITNAQNNQKPKSSWKTLPTILAGAGVASFGVFAIISKLATPDIQIPQNTGTTITIVEAPKEIISRPTKTIIVTKPMPELVKPTKPPKTEEEPVLLTEKALIIEPEAPVIDETPVFTVKNTVITKAPTVYPKQAIKQKIEGKVILNYQINADGKAEKVIVDKSDHRILSNAAKEALASWRFPEKESAQPTKQHSVEFVFKLD